MKKKTGIFICFLVMNGLVSCSYPARYSPFSPQEKIDKNYQAVSALLTQTAQASFSPVINPAIPTVVSTLPVSTATTPVYDTPSTIPSPSATRGFGQPDGKANAVPCDLAQLGFPIDINVPDGSHFLPEQPFVKTWRLYNAGSCKWTHDYALVWFSGDEMGVNQVQPLNAEVNAGGTIDVTIDMVAPSSPGTYQSNWKIRNKDGVMFGIGPNGDAPFWVRILVVPIETPTIPPPAIDTTPMPVVFASGSLTLLMGEGIDLDSAQINQAENDDLVFQNPDVDKFQLAPLTGAHLVAFGTSLPQMMDCNAIGSSDTPVVLKQGQMDMYFCYRTTEGLPGWITVESLDLEKAQVELEFVTWAVP